MIVIESLNPGFQNSVEIMIYDNFIAVLFQRNHLNQRLKLIDLALVSIAENIFHIGLTKINASITSFSMYLFLFVNID